MRRQKRVKDRRSLGALRDFSLAQTYINAVAAAARRAAQAFSVLARSCDHAPILELLPPFHAKGTLSIRGSNGDWESVGEIVCVPVVFPERQE